MQEAERQGLDVIPLLPQGYNEAELAAMGGAFDGGYIRNQLRSFQGDLNEAQQKYLEYTAKNGGQQSEISYYGWVNAALAYQGLVEAGPEFSQAKVVDGTNTLTDFTAGGIVPPQNWSKGTTRPHPTISRTATSSSATRSTRSKTASSSSWVTRRRRSTAGPVPTSTGPTDQPEHKSFD